MSSNSNNKQSILNHWEMKEKQLTQEEEHYIKAGNTLRALQCRRMREGYSKKINIVTNPQKDRDL